MWMPHHRRLPDCSHAPAPPGRLCTLSNGILLIDTISNPPPLAASHPVRRAALLFIFITVALDVLAIGVVIPVLPHLIEQFTGGDVGSAALWVGLFGTVFALMQFVFSPLQGALSDRFGRRPVILLSNLGLGLDFILMALVNTLPLLFLGRILAGITSASFSTANAYIADVVPPEKRAGSYGMIGAAFGLGFIIGPAMGGYLSGIDLRLPFWVAAGLSLANFCYGWFILPESLPPARRAPFDLRRANPVGALVLLRRYPQVMGLAAVLFFSQLAHYVLNSVFVLYADYRYQWGPQQVGYTLALVGASNAVVQAGLVRRVVPWLGERKALLAGLGFGVMGFVLQGLAPNGTWFLLAIPLMALWGFTGPAVQALMTRQVDVHEQGRLQGAVASLASVAGIFGPWMFTNVFASFIGERASWHLPGAPFLLSGALLALGAVLAWRVTRQPRYPGHK